MFYSVVGELVEYVRAAPSGELDLVPGDCNLSFAMEGCTYVGRSCKELACLHILQHKHVMPFMHCSCIITVGISPFFKVVSKIGML